jgi:phosphate transport system substrate-binding protein
MTGLAFQGLLRAFCALLALFVSFNAFAEPIRGAGSTFAAPVISKWGTRYKDARADGGDYFTLDWSVDYEPVGSLAGVMRLQLPDLDFAATDAPLSAAEAAKRGYAQFPIVMGGIAVVANLKEIEPGSLRLGGHVLADIFSGKVRKWSDPAIALMNPGIALPDREIQVLRRQDGSGSTLAFTSYLSAASPEWQQRFGASTLIDWPVGRGVEGTSDLIALASGTADSITYVESGQVARAGLPTVRLQNQAGNFVAPSLEGFQAGLAGVTWDAGQHFFATTTNMPGKDAYPIAVVTYAIVPLDRGHERIQRVLDLFRLAYEGGGADATALGYIPLSPALSKQVEQYWSTAFGNPIN